MKCDECGGSVTVEREAVRRYDIGGLPHIELHGVEVTHCTTCGNETIAIPRIGQLHRAIAQAFVTQRRMLAHPEIRFLRKHIGLSGNDFAAVMGVARETVSRWETGSQPMGAVADRLLRMLVVNHDPTKSYAADDMLRALSDEPAPSKLASVPMWNDRDRGWAVSERSGFAHVGHRLDPAHGVK
jgi:putative zinc finger/helix-turn-helix YgiT family protein